MLYRTLGRTGTAVSVLALGTMDFGSLTAEPDAHAVLDTYVEHGGNLIDTANVYNDGEAEQIVRWLAKQSDQTLSRLVITTKARAATDPDDVNGQGLARRYLRRCLHASLRRLGRDSVDLYQLHGWDGITPVEETLSFLDDAVHAGEINYIGLSNFTGWQLQLMLSTAKAMGVQGPVTLQVQYNLLSRDSEFEIMPAARYNDIGILAWSPLAGGLLTGKYTRGTKPDSSTRAGSGDPLYEWATAAYMSSDQSWNTVKAVEQVAAEIGATPAQVALAWLIDTPGITAPIVGARNPSQLQDTLKAVEVTLSPEQRDQLDQVSAPTPNVYPDGSFGDAQRARHLNGGTALPDVVGGGSSAPLDYRKAQNACLGRCRGLRAVPRPRVSHKAGRVL